MSVKERMKVKLGSVVDMRNLDEDLEISTDRTSSTILVAGRGSRVAGRDEAS